MEELKRAIALLFKRKGGSQMTEKEFVFSASMDLRWLPPKDSQKLLDVALSRGVVTLEDGQVSPAFEIDGVEVPLDFSPNRSVLEMPAEEDMFSKILNHIMTKLDMDKKDAISRINAIQEQMEVEIEVAALLAGEELDIDMSRFMKGVEKEILNRIRAQA
ncbi:MAG: DUF2240 family protein [Thermoplasmata archaeon]|nr:DUF2240 family protein [Thermoplasmata archaeon]